MSPLNRRNPAMASKIATLQLRLAPLVPLPSGSPHPSFPKTLLAYHLLTEDELDSIAHHYHQSTPGPYSRQYPENMNWDKDFLARPVTASNEKQNCHIRRPSQQEQHFIQCLKQVVRNLQATGLEHSREETIVSPGSTSTGVKNPYANLSDVDRLKIKRRKFGKFIGLVGMETPVDEIFGRIQVSLDRAIERSQEDLRRNEEVMVQRSKMA